MNEKVSVVLPCYGQAHFLPLALASLAEQTRRPDEVVVIDDGSPDDVLGAAATFPFARVVRQENRGLSGARNRGISETTGSYLVFLDSDDRLLPEALEANLARLREFPDAAFAWGFNGAIDEDGHRLTWPPTSFSGAPTYVRLLERNVVGAPVGVMFRRGPLVEAGGFRPDLAAAEDYECYLRLARRHRYVCTQKVIAEYRIHGENMSGDLGLMYESVMAVLADQEPFVRGDPALRRALARGRRDARQRYDGKRRVEETADHVAARAWLPAMRAGTGLLVRHPLLLLRAVVRRLARPLGR